jgi:hypothetical protein
MSPETKMNSLILTKQERNLILDQLDQYKKSYWTENLFSNSILVGEDNMRGYMKKVYQEYSESFNNPTNSAIDKTNIIKNYSRPSVFEFSLPVYIRENSICVVFLSYYCGDPCGFDELCFYKKENNTWKKYIVVYKGDF